MSHQPERKEKNCLNCGTIVIGRYCHVCGQENIETKESFWSLTRHFVFDLLHFDGKFFHTIKYIFARPGFVAREYCLGKRASYLHPIRMYLFTSAVFFLVFFYINSIGSGNKGSSDKLASNDRIELIQFYQERLHKNPGDTNAAKLIALLKDTTKEISGNDVFALDPKKVFTINDSRYNNLREYDSVQNNLPSGQRDSWLRKTIVRKGLNFNEKYRDRPEEASKIFFESILHKLPYLLFLSLPFFALILKLLYIRRKNFYYSDHAVFTIYHYILSFILMLVLFGLSTLQSTLAWKFLQYVALAVLLIWPVYLLLEMKYFYRQGWLKTIGKFLLLNLLGFVVLFTLLVALFLFSVFEL